MNKAVFKYIEHELYSYDETKRAMEEIRNNIISSTPFREVAVNEGYVGDSTGSRAIRLVTSTALAHMTRVTIAIEKVLARVNEEHRQLFELKYRQCLPWQQICREMPVSERTYFRLRRELVELVAWELGLAENWQE